MDQRKLLFSSWPHLFWENFFFKWANPALCFSVACQSPCTWAAGNLGSPVICDLTPKIQFFSFFFFFTSLDSGLLGDCDTTSLQISRNCSAYFDKNVTCCTRKNAFKSHRDLLLLYWYSSRHGEWNRTEVVRDWAATYCSATIYRRHFVSGTFC